jgi:choline-sulfatase
MHRLRATGRPVVSIGKLHYRAKGVDHGFSDEILPMYLANEGRGWPQGLIRDPLPGYDEAAELARDVGRGETTYTEYDRAIAAEAARWLRLHGSRGPWALFVSFVSPHYPLMAPPAFHDLYDGIDLPAPVAAGERHRHPVLAEMQRFWSYDDHFDAEARAAATRGYFGLCSFLDHCAGEVLSALDNAGATRETVVLSISDHGEMLGAHGFWAKSVMYEDSVGVPMILAGPGIPQGVNPTPVSLTDVAATAAEVAGIVPPPAKAPWQGRSLLGFARSPEPDRPVLSEYHDGGSPTGITMVMKGRWKYVHYAGGHPPQLFDLASDPRELTDLGQSTAHREVLASLDRALRAMLDPEAVNAAAFADQRALVEAWGGREAILSLPGFGHTPVGS